MAEIQNDGNEKKKKVLTVRTLLVGVTSEEPHSSPSANKTHLKMERITEYIYEEVTCSNTYPSMLQTSRTVKDFAAKTTGKKKQV